MKTQIYLKTSLILVFCIGWSIHLNAQLSISSEYRPRFEIRDGYQKLAVENSIPTALVSHRLRLSFKYETESLKTIQAVQNDKFSQFFYLQLTIAPVIFSQK